MRDPVPEKDCNLAESIQDPRLGGDCDSPFCPLEIVILQVPQESTDQSRNRFCGGHHRDRGTADLVAQAKVTGEGTVI